MNIQSFFSEITCGEACWSAVNDVCVCYCGGKNHGIHTTDKLPMRSCKMNGYRYKFVGCGASKEIYDLQRTLLEKYGIARCYNYYGEDTFEHQTYKDQFRCRGDKDYYGFPVVSKKATLRQCQKWHELKSYKDQIKTKADWYRFAPRLLWEIIEPPPPIKHKCNEGIIK